MEVIFELLFELVFQFVFEVVMEAGFHGLGRALANRYVRAVLGVGLALSGGYGAGWWWGERLNELGRTTPPRSLWISLAFAVAFTGLAVVRVLRERNEVSEDRGHSHWRPWRWSPWRLLGFALLNVSVAGGIAAGFDPRPLS